MNLSDREYLYQQAYKEFYVSGHATDVSAIRAVVDLVLDAQAAERPPWEVLREAVKVVGRVEMQTEYIRARIEWLTETADVLESEHQAAQEKAEREEAIRDASAILSTIPAGSPRTLAKVLVDAGWRPAPVSDCGAA